MDILVEADTDLLVRYVQVVSCICPECRAVMAHRLLLP